MVDSRSSAERPVNVGSSETTKLLGSATFNTPAKRYGTGRPDSPLSPEAGDGEYVAADHNVQPLTTNWKREVNVIIRYAVPLTCAFLLQSSLTVTSTLTIGRIGRVELGAVALGGMTATITGYSVMIGLATSLDTLCPQAYGANKKPLVGLHMQRMILFLLLVAVPIACIWIFVTPLLRLLLPADERDIADLAGSYLKVAVLGLPGYACFESGKRYVQAQGQFKATLCVLLVVAPINVLLHWLFVWQFQWGFIGCPIALVISQTLLPVVLFLYTRLFIGLECWGGFSTLAFTSWRPMVMLALPGMIMVMAEYLAFEILTIISARFSSVHLGAQTILMNLVVIVYMAPFSLSIAGSTRLANHIGAANPEAAKLSAKVFYTMGAVIGVFNMVLLSSLHAYIPRAFTSDEEVIALASKVLPVNAAFQLFDALTGQCNGILRGLGKQSVGGWISVLAFYVIAIPLSLGTAFGLGLELYGLWLGPACALFTQSSLETLYIYKVDWQLAAKDAARRTESA